MAPIKQDYLCSDDSHNELNSEDYSLYLDGQDSESLEADEVMHVDIGRPWKFVHSADHPVWEVQGFCYLAAIKERALPLYRWHPNISIKNLAYMVKSFRKDVRFDIVSKLRCQKRSSDYHLLINDMSKSGWPELVAMAEGRNADCTIGGDDDKNIPVLNGTNWQIWKFKMRAYLQSKECWLIVDGTRSKPRKFDQVEYSVPAVIEVDKGVEKVITAATTAWKDTTKGNDDTWSIAGWLGSSGFDITSLS